MLLACLGMQAATCFAGWHYFEYPHAHAGPAAVHAVHAEDFERHAEAPSHHAVLAEGRHGERRRSADQEAATKRGLALSVLSAPSHSAGSARPQLPVGADLLANLLTSTPQAM